MFSTNADPTKSSFICKLDSKLLYLSAFKVYCSNETSHYNMLFLLGYNCTHTQMETKIMKM